MVGKTVMIEGMTCQGCVKALRNALNPLVGDVEVDLASGAVHIADWQPGSEPALAEAVSAAGFQLQPLADGSH